MLRPVTREQYVTVPVSGVAREGDICPDTDTPLHPVATDAGLLTGLSLYGLLSIESVI